MKYFISVLFLGLLIACKGQQGRPVPIPGNSNSNSLLWEISGKGLSKPSYIFGTFHLMCKPDIYFSPNLRTALSRAEEVYFEMDLDNNSEMMSDIFFMNMHDGKSLKDLYDSADYAKLNRYFTDSLSLPFAAMQKIKPAFLESMLYTKMLDCKNMSGVEEALMEIVKQEKKEIKGFETMAFQASVFDSIPYEIQAKSLLKSIDSLEQGRVEFAAMVDAYKAQDLQALEKIMKNQDDLEGSNEELLLYSRNRNWVKKLDTIMFAHPVFAAVGAGHLVGENGLISLLKKQGYTLRPIDNR